MAPDAEVRMIRRHAPLVVACLVAGALTAALLSARTPREYQSDVGLFVSATRSATSGGVYDRARFAQERVKSYVPLVTSPSVMSAVIKDLELGTTPERLAQQLSVTASPDTVLLRIVATDRSAATARDIANATAEEFAHFAVALEGRDGSVPSVQLRITKPAELNRTPVRPRTAYNLALGVFFGLLMGLGLAALRERWSPTPATTPEPQDEPAASAWPPHSVIEPHVARRASHRPS